MLPPRPSLLALAAVVLAGCPKAVTRVGDQLSGRVCFTVEPGWELTQNYRWFGTEHIALAPDPPSRSLTVDLRKTRGEGEDLPLDLVAEGVVGEFGRAMGVVTEATAEHEIALAGYRAVALTGTRRHGPRQMEFTAWVARPPGRLLVVQLHTPPGQLHAEVLLLQRVLESLRLPLEPPPPDTLEGD
ncbi:MAG: hypothetical protein ABIO70_29055 [Pseudomonadota bacterium]